MQCEANGWNFLGCTKPELDVTVLVTFETLFRRLRVQLWQKLKQFICQGEAPAPVWGDPTSIRRHLWSCSWAPQQGEAFSFWLVPWTQLVFRKLRKRGVAVLFKITIGRRLFLIIQNMDSKIPVWHVYYTKIVQTDQRGQCAREHGWTICKVRGSEGG